MENISHFFCLCKIFHAVFLKMTFFKEKKNLFCGFRCTVIALFCAIIVQRVQVSRVYWWLLDMFMLKTMGGARDSMPSA